MHVSRCLYLLWLAARVYKSTRHVFFARFALSIPPLACSQGIQVHQARFSLHVLRCLNLRLLAARVYTQIHYLHRSAYIVRAPRLVLEHTQSLQVWRFRQRKTYYTSPPDTFSFVRFALSIPPSVQAPRYPMDWRDSVLSAPQVPWGLAGLIPFRPPCTLRSGGTHSFQAPRYPWDWQDSILSGPQVPWRLAGLSLSGTPVP